MTCLRGVSDYFAKLRHKNVHLPMDAAGWQKVSWRDRPDCWRREPPESILL
jgi:hypothetical protein